MLLFCWSIRYYRKKYNLSQEKFTEILGTTLLYLNQIENNKIEAKSSTIDKFARNINKFDKKHITTFSRIDEKKNHY